MPAELSITSSPSVANPVTDGISASVTISPATRPTLRRRRRGRSTDTSSLSNLGFSTSGGFGTGIRVSSTGTGTSIGLGVGLNISSRGISIKGAPSLSGGSIQNAAQNIAINAALGVAKKAGLDLNMSPTQALDTLAPNLRQDITNAVSGQISQAISGISFPSLQFPGLGQISMIIGAGPKWLAEQLMKYKLIVPPFIPGLKINMAMVSAALSIIRAAASGNLGQIAKSILEDLLEDIKEQSGLAELEEQVKDQIAEVTDAIDTVKDIAKNGINVQLDATIGILSNAEGTFVDQYNRENPPQTIINDDGETETINPPPADTSLYSNLKGSIGNVGSDVQKAVSGLGTNLSNAVGQLGSNISNMASNSGTNTPSTTPTSPPTG